MSCITVDDLATILLGTEHAGNANTVYRVSYAVPNSLLGVAQGGNNSGFSFGIVQLDIGVNQFAQQAYTDILHGARAAGVISEPDYNRLLQYRGDSRYDLDPALANTYQQDRVLLNDTIFNQQFARDIIDDYNAQYLEQQLLGTVRNFLTAMTVAWGDESVFAYSHPDYHLAVAAVTSIANRTGGLTQTTQFFQQNQPDAIADVRARFEAVLPGNNDADWQLVQIGGNLYEGADPRYEGVSSTTSFSAAISQLDVESLSDVAALYLKSELGNCVEDVTFRGSGSAAFLVDRLSVPGVFSLEGGILLSSGGYPGSANTSESFTIAHGTQGDAALSQTATAAFPGAGATRDASVIEFTFNVVDPRINGVSFDIVFGSDEFPEFSDTTFVDVAAIYVNGTNFALFNNNPSTPLSVTQANLAAGNFVDNESGSHPIEWDGFSRVLTVRAPVQIGENTIKIGVADTGDQAYDSALYISDIELLSEGGTGGGVLNVVNGSSGNDSLSASSLAEEINLIAGSDTIVGTPSGFNGDVITGFGPDDSLTFLGVTFGPNDMSVTFGSAILAIDTDQDGATDTTLTLTGDFEGATFSAANVAGNTVIMVAFEPEESLIEGTDGSDDLSGTPGADTLRSFGGSYDRMSGGEMADTFVFGAEASNGLRERDVIRDYEVGVDMIRLEAGATIGAIRASSTGATIFLNGDGDAIYVQGDGVTPGNLTILEDEGVLI